MENEELFLQLRQAFMNKTEIRKEISLLSNALIMWKLCDKVPNIVKNVDSYFDKNMVLNIDVVCDDSNFVMAALADDISKEKISKELEKEIRYKLKSLRLNYISSIKINVIV